MARTNTFFWYDLMTSDPQAAGAFYANVVGWTLEDWPGDMPYTMVKAAGTGVGGIMAIPDEAKAVGARPGWLGYVKVDDADRAAAAVTAAGGSIQREPEDIPHVGRFAVVCDPQGAVFMMLAPTEPDQPGVPLMTPGHVGWHELYSSDPQKGFAFYETLFGWAKADALDMGPMGTYQLFADSRDKDCGAVGGMMRLPEGVPVPVWGFYFAVEAIDAAVERITSGGGRVLMPPMEVPGGSWIVNALDPQGAHFALVAPKR
ncbi:VOC family protein [Enterovirga rhinocerotis]|uniref:VOC domain-containing protein n=1 Tax=Enterovirga rhinocerotis TaxID=1339210 RepID=A0A4R7C8F8_9HYPH|nr:VOC family protein [Enterovirga rhinocerotis]TDR94910.1 hypothetical protein EV668_2201 [Enterovirga rhinocerotis]